MILLVAGLFAFRAVGGLGLSILDDDANPTLTASILVAALEGVALTGAVALGMLRKRLSWKEVGLQPISREWILLSVALGIIATVLAAVVGAVIAALLGLEGENPQLPFLAPGGFSVGGLIGMTLLAGFVAPFAEELLFRGVLYRWIRDRWGYIPALLLSSLLFGIAHVDPLVAVTAFVAGLVLAWSYERSGSLWTPVLVHVVYNAPKIVLIYLLLFFGVDLGIS